MNAAADLARFRATRTAALATLDLDYARRVFPNASSDELLLATLHKARYECADIDAALRVESRTWLESRGFSRLNRLPWPSPGELP